MLNINYENLTDNDLIDLGNKAKEFCDIEKLDIVRRIQDLRCSRKEAIKNNPEQLKFVFTSQDEILKGFIDEYNTGQKLKDIEKVLDDPSGSMEDCHKLNAIVGIINDK
jgi:hypothetical protein